MRPAPPVVAKQTAHRTGPETTVSVTVESVDEFRAQVGGSLGTAGHGRRRARIHASDSSTRADPEGSRRVLVEGIADGPQIAAYRDNPAGHGIETVCASLSPVAEPDAAGAIHVRRIDVRVRHAFRHAVGREQRALETVQPPGVRAEPEAPFTVEERGRY